jgi:hypothetical protein
MNVVRLKDLSRPSQVLLGEIAAEQVDGQVCYCLPSLAAAQSATLSELHEGIAELAKANFLRMERLGCDDGAALVRFHLSTTPKIQLARLNEECFGGEA